MHDGVAFGGRKQLARVVEAFHLLHQRLQFARLVLGAPARGVPGGQRFQRRARFEDLDGLLDREPAHARAAVALADHQPVVAEPEDRLANGAAAPAQLLGELLLDQPFTGVELARDDGGVQGRICAALAHAGTALADWPLPTRLIAR